MPEHYLVAPIPQLDWTSLPEARLSQDITIGPLPPHVRRKLLNAVKKEGNASDRMLSATISSECIIAAKVPDHSTPSFFTSVLYSHVLDLVLKRFIDMARLWEDVRDCFDRSCWFCLDGAPGDEAGRAEAVDPEWDCGPIFQSAYGIGEAGMVPSLKVFWERCSVLLQIEELNRLFVRYLDGKVFNYSKARECVNRRITEFTRERVSGTLGVPPEKVEIILPHPQGGGTTEDGNWTTQEIVVGVPPEYAEAYEATVRMADLDDLIKTWFIEEWTRQYFLMCRGAERDRYIMSAGCRFLRGYQAFANSFRMEDPFRYVARATCLESLFGQGSAELTHQLAERTAWLLHPSDAVERTAMYKQVKGLYDLRSKIVHGDKYKGSTLDEQGDALLSLVRKILLKLLFTDQLHHMFFEATAPECDSFLQKLSIGCASCGGHKAEPGDREQLPRA